MIELNIGDKFNVVNTDMVVEVTDIDETANKVRVSISGEQLSTWTEDWDLRNTLAGFLMGIYDNKAIG